MGNHRSLAMLLRPTPGLSTALNGSDGSGDFLPPLVAEAISEYAKIWTLDADQYLPQNTPVPSNWVLDTPPWVGSGITPKRYYRDPQGRYWMLKHQDAFLWCEVASAQVFDVLQLPHVPVTFTNPHSAEEILQPLFSPSQILSQAPDPSVIPQVNSDHVASVMHLGAQWLVAQEDGHNGNFLLRSHPESPTHSSVMPIDFGITWAPESAVPDPSAVHTSAEAHKWLVTDIGNSNALLVHARMGQFKGISDAQWGELTTWADRVASLDDSAWNEVRTTVFRGVPEPDQLKQWEWFRDRAHHFGDCMRVLSVLIRGHY